MQTEQIADEMSLIHWERYQPRKPTQADVLEAFPEEAKEIVPALIEELTHKRKALVQYIGDELALINAESEDEVYRHYWRVWLMLNEGEELQETDRKLAYQYRLKRLIEGKPAPKGVITDDMIEAARVVPITDVIGEPIRRSGKDYLCLCPMHDDHSPSLRVYTEQNRAWCYSCNDGGDSIKFYMLIHGCDFRTAVHELVGAVA